MRRVQLVMFLIATALPVPSVAEQQIQPLTSVETTETNRAPIIPFLEGTDVFWTLVKKDALDDKRVFFPNKLEANIFPHLVFYQNFTDILDIDRQVERAAGSEG